jgi:hypothetical protein
MFFIAKTEIRERGKGGRWNIRLDCQVEIVIKIE